MESALVHEFLEWAAFAELAVEDGEDDIAGGIEGGGVVGEDIGEDDCVAGLFESVGDGFGGVEGDLAFMIGAAAED